MEGGENQDGTGPYDPVSKRLIKPVFQRIIKGKPEVAMSEIWKGKSKSMKTNYALKKRQ